VLLNGVAGLPIKHGRGLRQGDPLSPFLFVLAIDTLAQILERATSHNMLHKLKGRGNILRTSLYADDAAIFVAPIKEDIQNLARILHNFGKVTGLSTNFLKTAVVPIRCGNLDLDGILHGIPAKREAFPLRYLGLPLTVRCLKRGDIQHLEDKCAGKLPNWNGKYITAAGRAALVKSVIASQAIYYLTLLSISASTIAFINKIERAFLWSAKDHTTGAKCKVNWELVCRPKKHGGLGILHMDKFATALRLRWPWLEWKDPTKIWAGSGNPCTEQDLELFYTATIITVGNGKKTPFWHAPWLEGKRPIDIAPLVFAASKRKKWKVAQALHQNAWIQKIDFDQDFSFLHLSQFIELSSLVDNFQLQANIEDDISWRLTENGCYASKSAYEVQFLGSTMSPLYKSVWKVWAPPKIKFFAWLVNQDRIWTADRLAKRGWPNCGLCPLCKRCTESVDHLFVHCRFTMRLWERVKEWLGIPHIHPNNWGVLSFPEWWGSMATGQSRGGVASLSMLIIWELWNE
jgi:hypothetical protein